MNNLILILRQDKQYLVKALLSDGVSVKPQKVKRVPGSSGKLHKNEEGEWEWSDDEMDPDEQGEETRVRHRGPVKAGIALQKQPNMEGVIKNLIDWGNEMNVHLLTGCEGNMFCQT